MIIKIYFKDGKQAQLAHIEGFTMNPGWATLLVVDCNFEEHFYNKVLIDRIEIVNS